ncbi:MAG: glycosyltransferase family 2 protein [Anaerolineae bacterium]|nr:glycosyltransferase family 2 protein [Anaerolineae bacterium]
MTSRIPPSVYIVTVTWNNVQDTIECLDSLYRVNYSNMHIVVVDNGSTDGTCVILKSRFPDISILEHTENLGFARGYNAGMQWALGQGAEVVFILNNDTTVDPELLDEWVQYTKQHTEPAVWVPKIYYYDEPTRIWCAGARKTRFPPRIKMIGLDKMDGPRFSHPGELDCATGCALLIHRQVLQDVGMFDPIYTPAYQEDYDLCFRIKNRGYKIFYMPTAKVWHKVSRSEHQPGSKWYNLGKNTVPLYIRHYRLPFLALFVFAGWVVLRKIVKRDLANIPVFLSGLKTGLAESRPKSSE